jgi:quercetin dioxygenase-like cupin family protein
MNYITPTPSEAEEIIDIFVGARLSYITPQSSATDEFCLIKVEMPSGVTVPVHSHEDRETFYILAGELQGMSDGRWETFRSGRVFDVKNGMRHAIRNSSAEPMTLLMVTTMKLGQFFRDVGRPHAPGLAPPTPADLEHFARISDEYGYWMGTPEDNLAVGIKL